MREIRQGTDKEKDTGGDVMIWGLWYQQADAIIDVKLGDADADSYTYEPMAALLAHWETIKKDVHGKQYQNQWKYFSPFVLSVDGVLEREALVILAQFNRTMA